MFSQKLLAGIARRAGALDSALLSSTFNGPHSITQISKNQFIISDSGNDSLRLLDVAANTVSTVDTTSPHCNLTNILQKPRGLCYFENNVFIADAGNSKIRILDGSSGYATTFAGSAAGYEDCATQKSRFDRPASVAVSHVDGTIYIADTYNHCIRMVRRGSDLVETLIGVPGKPGFIDKIDELKGKPAQFNCPVNLIILKSGNLLIADTCNHAVRHIHVGARLVTTVVGQSRNSYTHACVKFRMNDRFDVRAIDEQFRYHVYCEYQEDKNKEIIQQSTFVKNPEALLQLPDGSVLVATPRQMFRINATSDAIQPLTELSIGRVTGLCLDQFSDCVFGVDHELGVVWEFQFKDQGQMTSIEKSVRSKNRLNQEKLNGTQDVSKTQIAKTQSQELIDFERFNQIVATFGENAGRFDAGVMSKLALFMSCTKPAWACADKALSQYAELFVREVLNRSEFLDQFLQLKTNKQILQAMSQAVQKNQLAASIQLFDVDLVSQFGIQKPHSVEYFVGNYAEAITIKLNLALCSDVLASNEGKIYLRAFDESGNQIAENVAREILDSPLFGDRYKTIYGGLDIQTLVYNSAIIQVNEGIQDDDVEAVQRSVIQNVSIENNILNASNWFKCKFLVDCYEEQRNGTERLLSGRVGLEFRFVMTELKLVPGPSQKVLLRVAKE